MLSSAAPLVAQADRVPAAASTVARPTVKAVRIQQPPIIDGRLDDPAWRTAARLPPRGERIRRSGRRPYRWWKHGRDNGCRARRHVVECLIRVRRRTYGR